MLASNPGREFRLDSVIDRFLASSADRALGRRERPEMRCALRISSPDWTVIASRARTAISSQDGDLAHRLADCKEIPVAIADPRRTLADAAGRLVIPIHVCDAVDRR
jgi:hypothetical protein